LTAICKQAGAAVLSEESLKTCKVVKSGGVGFVFWTRINGVWWRRVIKLSGGFYSGNVTSVEAKVKC
jgi:hypothetical protein